MKAKEAYIGSKKECKEEVKRIISELFNGDLKVEGQKVDLPYGEELTYKVKFENNELYNFGSVGFKIAWGEEPEGLEEEEEEEEEEEQEEKEEEEKFRW